MSDYRELLQEADICELKCAKKFEALHELITLADSLTSLPDSGEFEHQIRIREQKQSTGIGKGIAIAHATTDQVRTIRVALGISHSGIDFDSIDGQPVHLLFLVANPPNTQVEYLSVLSALVRLLRSAQFRASIICCSSPKEIKSLLDSSLSFEMSA
ncbi:MAG: PTS sugar transporter subunit IIA [Spirochaetia bacterium]